MINIVDNIDSTNTWLTQFNNDFFDSIISFKQSKGYGRLGRHWESDIGGLYYSVVLPYREILPIIVGVSVSEILVKYNIDIQLKWPNDILVEGKKLGGILCHTEGLSAIVGLGINVSNNPNLSESINLSKLGFNFDKLHFIENLSKKIVEIISLENKEISINEPFKGLFTQGMVCHETYKDKNNNWVNPEDISTDDGKKFYIKNQPDNFVTIGPSESMSKSKKNTIDPEKIIETYGADAVRLFILSDSPPEKDVQWSDNGMASSYKFI